MFSSVAANGLKSVLPPTVILCFTCWARIVSTLPGTRTWHPTSASSRGKTRISLRAAALDKALTGLLHHRDDHVHVPVVSAAEVVTNRSETSRNVRSQSDFCWLARLNYFVNFQLFHEEAMGHVLAGEMQRDRFSLLQGDLVGGETETLGRDLDNPRIAVRLRQAWRQGQRTNQRHQQSCQNIVQSLKSNHSDVLISCYSFGVFRIC